MIRTIDTFSFIEIKKWNKMLTLDDEYIKRPEMKKNDFY